MTESFEQAYPFKDNICSRPLLYVDVFELNFFLTNSHDAYCLLFTLPPSSDPPGASSPWPPA